MLRCATLDNSASATLSAWATDLEAGLEELLVQITSYAASLPFEFNSPSFVPYVRESLDSED